MTTREERAELREWLTHPGDPEGNAPLTRREAHGLLDDIDRLTAERDEARLLMGDWAARAGAAEAERDDLAAAIERVRALPATPPSGGYYMVSMREVLCALDGADQ